MSAQIQTPTNTNGHTPTTPAFSEAPASATVKVTTPGGYDLMITFRATRVADLLQQAQTVEGWLIAHNFTPAPAFKGNGKPSQGDAAPADAPLCPTHQKPMKPGKNGGWYCPVKLLEDDGTGKPVYCKQRK